MAIWLPVLWMATGICLFAGIHFIHVGSQRRTDRVYLAFGWFCLLVAAYNALSTQLQMLDDVTSLVPVERAHVAVACLVFPAAVWFFGLYTGLRQWRRWLAVAAVLFAALLVLDLASTPSLLLSDLTLLPPLTLPWGERITQFSGAPARFAWLYYLATFLVYVWAVWRCWVLWRHGTRERALPLAIYILIQLAAQANAEYVTVAGTRSIDWDAVPFLALVLLVSRSLTREMQLQSDALATGIEDLRTESARLIQAQQRLRHLAYHDALTDLPNRRALWEAITETIESSRPSGVHGALIVIDLDHFKIINDALGHSIGDQLLCEIAHRLRLAYPGARCASRLGGDEFALLLERLGADAAETQRAAGRIAGELTQQLAEPFHLGEHELTTGISAGIALVQGDTESAETLLRQADLALHRAKASGRSATAMYSAVLQDDAKRRLALEKGLRLAIERDELRLFFQPQIDRHGGLVGAEALLRWKHAEFGFVEPGDFIPLAEETGLIHPLGRFVLQRACAALRTWPSSLYPPPRLAINISPWQLALPDFVTMVTDTLRASGVAPGLITLEITESAFLHDVADAAAKIRQLDAFGIRVAIDDFGTGYASIATLKALPVRELKIDQVFIRDMTTSPGDRFVEAVITLARGLDLYIVAEGVETEAQRAALAAMGCNAFQGYLISRPLDQATLHDWAQRNAARIARLTTDAADRSGDAGLAAP
ncbi:MAG: EAL domain-containing protein [Xanthomonadaceae bacterium]|nr:EAL domain-containing protein [Xanthomonadaceae bacterium]MDE1958886.1 EAL domain-containing protein [Xanthomonadaceae bacterium]MDE2245564.1 EAL domain-containing protein [Xanthomonadaceae bacterium]